MILQKRNNVCVIIVTHNGKEWVDRCFGSLLASSIPVIIFVVDNASNDDTVKHIREKYAVVEVIETGRNMGFGQANNIGIQRALEKKADYVFLLNQDAWVETDTIEQLINTAEENKEFGIISPMHWNGQGNGLEIKFNEYINPYDTPGLSSDLITNQGLRPIYESHFINAASWLIPTRCIEQVGGFDPLFGHYGEDEDYVRRMQYFGFKLGVVPAARIFHDTLFKSWDLIKWNRSRMLIVQYLALKKMDTPFRSCVLKYYKDSFNRLTDLLLFRKWKEFRFLCSIVWSTTWQLSKIKTARKKSLKRESFLNY